MISTVQNKSSLDTPCLVLDLDVLDRNLLKMQAIAGKAGRQLRPHAKTHKCSVLARRQIEAGAIGVCVAKVSEAEALARAGISGILITGPVTTPQKIRRLIEVLAKSTSLIVTVDHPAGVDMLSAALRKADLSMDVLLDIDVGLHRTGVAPADALKLAEHILSKPNLRLRGIQAYAGQVQHLRSYADRKRKSLACLEKAARVFNELRGRVKSCTVFSASGTGTHDIDLLVPEVTELQVGSYACMDAEYMAIGSAGDSKKFTLLRQEAPWLATGRNGDFGFAGFRKGAPRLAAGSFTAFGPALRLLTTVVSVNRRGFVTVDAGLKSLYRDGPAPRIIAPGYTQLRFDWFGDEYGKISGGRLPALGAVLELIPSHCDPTVNLFDRFFLTRGAKVVGSWAIDLRGCSQ